MKRVALVLAMSLAAGAARAEDDDVASKTRLDAKALGDKRERGYFTGLPLVNYDSNTGLGLGARVYYLNNGERDDPRFEYTPYLHRIYVQGFVTTGGAQYHSVDYDAPYVARSAYRVRASAAFERNIIAPYFGRGA